MGNKSIVRKGELLAITEGAYSSYGVLGMYKVLVEFKPYEELDKYLQINPDQGIDYRFSPYEFLSYLDKKGYFEEVPTVSLHLGDYSNASEVYLHGGF